MKKKLLTEELERLQRQTNLMLSRADDSFRAELRKVIARYIKEIKLGLANGSMLAAERTVTIATIGQQLEAALREAGIEDVMNGYAAEFPQLTKDALKHFELFGYKADFQGVDLATFEGLIQYAEGGLREISNERLVKPMRDRIIQLVTQTTDVDTVAKEMTQIIDSEGIFRKDGKEFTESNIEVYAGDSYAQYHRQVQALEGERLGLDELVIYIGPNDEVTRPACQAMLKGERKDGSGVWSRENFTTAIHKDLEQPPLIAGGGWNCRHSVRPISPERAKEVGYSGK